MTHCVETLSKALRLIPDAFQTYADARANGMDIDGKQKMLLRWMKDYHNYEMKNKNVFDCIATVHDSMRDKHITDPEHNSLQSYAQAATYMGKKEWVKGSNEYLLKYSKNHFFENGCKRAYLKRKRNEYVEANGKEEIVPSSLIDPEMLSTFPHTKIKLLGVKLVLR